MPMATFIDRTGQKIGRLTVLSRSANLGGKAAFLCRCECGKEKVVRSANLGPGKTVSCGCYQHSLPRTPTVTHGMEGTPTYESWCAMKQRCTNPKHRDWKRYGGRGIKVCSAWLSFTNFLADMGVCPPGLTIERMDNDGNYEKSNCKWATRQEQSANRGGKFAKKECN